VLVSALARGVELNNRTVDELATSFGGSLIRPDDTTYDEQRGIWNGSIERRPALIAQCAGVADVISAVRFARHHEQLVAVRSGRHSYPGLGVCDGGMVIDLGQMKGIRVDPQARTARAQAGVLLGDLDRETQAFGFAVPAGIVTHTGLAGLTLGGGIGWLERKYGLTIDQLLSVDMVTAEGEFVQASQDENTDLFWGSGAEGGTSGLSQSSNSGSTRSARRCSPGPLCGRWRTRRRSFASTGNGSRRCRTS
jgi:FAD/FMN-containing dehydrogenase